MEHVYEVEVSGNDYDPEYGWSDEHYWVMVAKYDSYEDAVALCESITVEQAFEWELETGCNGLDVVVFEYEVTNDGTRMAGFPVVAEYEWIGPNRNLPAMIWSEA